MIPSETIIHNQKRTADIILSRLEIIDPTCILAGGAPRDWWLGKPANDLDFYVYSRHVTEHDFMHQLRGVGLGGDLIRPAAHNVRRGTGEHDGEPYASMPNLMAVYETDFEGQKVQIMRMSEPTYTGVVDNFACSLSRVWYKGGRTRVYREAELTREHKIGFFPRNYSNQHRYIQKMTQRFPEITWCFGEDGWKNMIQYREALPVWVNNDPLRF